MAVGMSHFGSHGLAAIVRRGKWGGGGGGERKPAFVLSLFLNAKFVLRTFRSFRVSFAELSSFIHRLAVWPFSSSVCALGLGAFLLGGKDRVSWGGGRVNLLLLVALEVPPTPTPPPGLQSCHNHLLSVNPFSLFLRPFTSRHHTTPRHATPT